MLTQPSHKGTSRRSAAFDSPPAIIGGCGCCTGSGSEYMPSEIVERPEVLGDLPGPEPLGDRDRLAKPAPTRGELQPWYRTHQASVTVDGVPTTLRSHVLSTRMFGPLRAS